MDHNLRAVESHEAAKDKHSQEWHEAYNEAYERLPKDVGGVMLREAVDSMNSTLMIGDTIILCYLNGDKEMAATVLFMLLDSWRKRQAERIANKEIKK